MHLGEVQLGLNHPQASLRSRDFRSDIDCWLLEYHSLLLWHLIVVLLMPLWQSSLLFFHGHNHVKWSIKRYRTKVAILVFQWSRGQITTWLGPLWVMAPLEHRKKCELKEYLHNIQYFTCFFLFISFSIVSLWPCSLNACCMNGSDTHLTIHHGAYCSLLFFITTKWLVPWSTSCI